LIEAKRISKEKEVPKRDNQRRTPVFLLKGNSDFRVGQNPQYALNSREK